MPSDISELIRTDPLLEPFSEVIRRRNDAVDATLSKLTADGRSLADFASGHEYFGLHFRGDHWVFREWAPNASGIYLIGAMTGWREAPGYAMHRVDSHGTWELRLPASSLHHGDLYRLRIHWPGGQGDRIPAYARRVVQDPCTLIFNAQVWKPDPPYAWRNPCCGKNHAPPLIYEVHIGMAQDREGIGSYGEFTRNVLPRIIGAGYNTIQLMAIQEHPYYASFGYQVANFFAASSRFGTPEELKELIDTAHGAGLRVIMDIVHSHAVRNETEGLSRFDGTGYQYFHEGGRGMHPAWNSRCFDYGKPEVLHFLLSNCRYWLDEFRFDGLRFDGITSMLYLHHGLGMAFTRYEDYFGDQVDEDAYVYLSLANRLIHTVRPDAVTIAEDVSGMPGLAFPREKGGVGFDYRFAMGVPDFWIRLTRDIPDEQWSMGHLWYELTNRRREEKTISYAESHDQALVGDQTLIFRLMGSDIYHHMHVDDDNMAAARAVALHKMIRLITLATAANGYLNFMGNEFGHPEWIDFPRKGNGWSYRYARRQWHLADDPHLKYGLLARFDRAMIRMADSHGILSCPEIRLLHLHEEHKLTAFYRGGHLFVFNFHPDASRVDYRISAPPGSYRMILDTDSPDFGGHGRLAAGQVHHTITDRRGHAPAETLSLYIPSRSAFVLKLLEGDDGIQ